MITPFPTTGPTLFPPPCRLPRGPVALLPARQHARHRRLPRCAVASPANSGPRAEGIDETLSPPGPGDRGRGTMCCFFFFMGEVLSKPSTFRPPSPPFGALACSSTRRPTTTIRHPSVRRPLVHRLAGCPACRLRYPVRPGDPPLGGLVERNERFATLRRHTIAAPRPGPRVLNRPPVPCVHCLVCPCAERRTYLLF